MSGETALPAVGRGRAQTDHLAGYEKMIPNARPSSFSGGLAQGTLKEGIDI